MGHTGSRGTVVAGAGALGSAFITKRRIILMLCRNGEETCSVLNIIIANVAPADGYVTGSAKDTACVVVLFSRCMRRPWWWRSAGGAEGEDGATTPLVVLLAPVCGTVRLGRMVCRHVRLVEEARA